MHVHAKVLQIFYVHEVPEEKSVSIYLDIKKRRKTKVSRNFCHIVQFIRNYVITQMHRFVKNVNEIFLLSLPTYQRFKKQRFWQMWSSLTVWTLGINITLIYDWLERYTVSSANKYSI